MQKNARAVNPGGGVKNGVATADADRGSTAKCRTGAAKAAVPPAQDSRKFARVFMSGRSQAVRLPKESGSTSTAC